MEQPDLTSASALALYRRLYTSRINTGLSKALLEPRLILKRRYAHSSADEGRSLHIDFMSLFVICGRNSRTLVSITHWEKFYANIHQQVFNVLPRMDPTSCYYNRYILSFLSHYSFTMEIETFPSSIFRIMLNL